MTSEISNPKLIWLHLFPGLLILGLYILITPVLNGLGLPSLMSLMLCFLVVVVPFEIGYLIRTAKRKGITLSQILVNEALAKKKVVGIVIGGVVVSILVAGIGQFVDASIKDELFAWLPGWYMYDTEFGGYSKNILVITAVTRIFVDGLLIPYAEETYFRGYLLPRMNAKGLAVPFLASVLFALYHFWQPWNYLTLLVISAILVFPAWKFRNYKISLYIHMTINLLGSILFLLMVMQ